MEWYTSSGRCACIRAHIPDLLCWQLWDRSSTSLLLPSSSLDYRWKVLAFAGLLSWDQSCAPRLWALLELAMIQYSPYYLWDCLYHARTALFHLELRPCRWRQDGGARDPLTDDWYQYQVFDQSLKQIDVPRFVQWSPHLQVTIDPTNELHPIALGSSFLFCYSGQVRL